MATAPAAVSANKAELIAIADAVAREKLIDRGIVIEAMEDAIQRAARARYGAENDIRAKLDAETGDLRLWRVLEVVEEPAGIDRPLTRRKDYADWAGYEARITLAEQRDGRKQFSGTLQGLEGDDVKLTDKSGASHVLRFSDISSAKLLLTDKLINATAPLSTEGADTFQTVEE